MYTLKSVLQPCHIVTRCFCVFPARCNWYNKDNRRCCWNVKSSTYSELHRIRYKLCKRTGLTTLTYTVTRLFCVFPVRCNWYNMYNCLPAFYTIYSTCLFHVRSWEIVTPNSLARQTCAVSLPSIFIFLRDSVSGIVILCKINNYFQQIC